MLQAVDKTRPAGRRRTKPPVVRKGLKKEFFLSIPSYILVLPAIIVVGIFSYGPMYGLLLAFKDYRLDLGILDSPWNHFEHFKRLFEMKDIWGITLNTVIISFGRILFEFPVPIVIAILLNEVNQRHYRKTLQTLFTLPNFLSWVVLAGVIKNFLRGDGFINQVITTLGGDPVAFLTTPELFKPMLFITSIWKGMGWSAIVYLATITNIDQELYDAATVDGANRFQRILHITLPAMRGIITLSLLMSTANILNAGFDQIFNLMNDVVREAGQIIDTYIYQITFQKMPDYGFSTAVGLIKGVVNCALLLTADKIVRLAGGKGLYNA